MTMADAADDRLALQAAATRRLHPLSWVFILIQQLRSFALPLLLLLFTGRGEQNPADLIGLGAAAMLAVAAVWRYFTYRYGFLDRALVIRSGMLQRNLRLIPFDRVQNVTLHQSLLHRVMGVAEVRLESAGGMGLSEAQMRVLPMAQAHEIEARVRDRRHVTKEKAPGAGNTDVWLHLPTIELVRLGLISNRGMLVVAAAFAWLSQTGEAFGDLARAMAHAVEGGTAWAESLRLGPVVSLLAGAVVLLALLALVRALSVALAILQFHDFRLEADDGQLRIERGLLSRTRGQLPWWRIQAFSLHESLLHRWFGRQSLKVDRAAVEEVNAAQSLRDLVPLAPPAQMDHLLERLLPKGHWPLQQWQPLHALAWRRQFMPLALLALLGTASAVAWHGGMGLLGLLLLPVLYLRARVWARYSAWTLEGGVVAFRQGWLNRHWRFAEASKLQALRLTQSPLDRHHGMATLHLDTAGASPLEPALRIPYLPLDRAEALMAALRAAMPRDPGTLNRARIAASGVPAG